MKNIRHFNKLYRTPSALVLIAGNMAILVFALVLQWDVINIIMLYIAETFVIGIFNVVKMLKSQGKISHEGKEVKQGCLKLFAIPFFIFHYNFFVFIQLFIAYAFTDLNISAPETDSNSMLLFSQMWESHFFTSLAIITATHAFSFFFNYIGKKEYLKLNINMLMLLPYKRILFQQILVIFGGILLLLFQTPKILLIFYICLKTFFDLAAHLRNHSLEFFHQFEKKDTKSV